MEAIEDHWHEGQCLRLTAQLIEAKWSEHEAITMSALIMLGLDGMKRLSGRGVMDQWYWVTSSLSRSCPAANDIR